MADKDKKPDLSKFRNMGVIAHIDAGKTTTSEHILYYAGAVHRLGGVDEGNTELDWMEEERERGITIQSACIPFDWTDALDGQQYHFNLIDTPGHVDFTAEVERSLRVLDGCIVVFDAQKGVEAQSETVWRQADKYRVPRLAFVNKMDIVGADFNNTIAEIADRLEGRPVPVNIPIGSGSPKDSVTPFRGVVDLVTQEACFFEASSPERADGRVVRRVPIVELENPPEGLFEQVRTWREKLFDVVTEVDEKDEVTSKYLAGEDVPPAAVHALLRKRVLKNEVQPVLCGSGREHIGVQLLLDAVCRYLPSPLDKPPVVGRNPKKDREESRKPSPDEPLAALVFKIHGDEHGGLFYVRIYSGTLKANSRPLNAGKDVKEFATKIYHVRADPTHRDALDFATAGDIVALTGPKEAVTGDTLCDPAHPILLEPIRFAETVVSRSIEPESTGDRAKMEQLLNLLAREDPTFRWNIDPQTGQTLISGMGVLHLEIKEHRLTDDFRLRVRLGKPLVSYRETFRRPVKVVGDAARRITTGAVTAKLTVQFERVKSEQPVTVWNHLSTEKVTPLFAAVAEQSLRESLTSGQLGYPMMEVRATILDLETQEGATNEVAVRAAAADAVHQALDENVILLEPIMRLEVTVPEDFVGPVTGDLNKRRAEITEMHARGKLRIVEALVPLMKMFDYTEAVRSLSQGRATPSMEPHSYREAPEDVLDRMLHPEKYL